MLSRGGIAQFVVSRGGIAQFSRVVCTGAGGVGARKGSGALEVGGCSGGVPSKLGPHPFGDTPVHNHIKIGVVLTAVFQKVEPCVANKVARCDGFFGHQNAVGLGWPLLPRCCGVHQHLPAVVKGVGGVQLVVGGGDRAIGNREEGRLLQGTIGIVFCLSNK